MGWRFGPNAVIGGGLQIAPGSPGLDTSSAGALDIGLSNATSVVIAPTTTFNGQITVNGNFFGGGHWLSTLASAPTTTNLGTNVTSVTFTGGDVKGKIVIVMGGALAANTRIATCTWHATYGGVTPQPALINQTSGVGLTIVNFYSGSESATAFDLFSDQALATGTYTIRYINLGA